MEPRDLSGFDKHVLSLFRVSKQILEAQDSRSLNNRKNPMLVRLEKYEKIYKKTDPDEHVGYFEKIYNDNKRFILLGPQRDGWLAEGNIVISYGQECNLKTEMKFYLSAIYNASIKLREENKGLPDMSPSQETYYPDDFMLEIYTIFREIAVAESEISKLNQHLEDLGEVGNNGSDPLSGLFDMASGMAEKVSGQKIPKDKMPRKNDLGKMLSSVMDNPQTKNMLGSMMEEFKNSGNMGEMFTKMVGGLGAVAGNTTENTDDETPALESPESQADVNDEFSE